MSITAAQKRANSKWSKEHMVTISVRVRKEVADDFDEACNSLGFTKSGVLKQAIKNIIIVAKGDRGGE